MKKLEQIRENYDLITEKEEAESRKLTTLVRAGLFDPKKLPMLKRALSKDAKDMTPAERKILIELLDSLMAEVLQSQQVYSKVKQNVMMKEEEEILDEAKAFDGYYSKYDPRYTKMPTDREIPTVVILKRKAIRIYPDNQKVALYYSQTLDKYVTIPFGTMQDSTMNEEIEQDEDDPYIVKSTHTKYKNKDDAKNIAKMHGSIENMKRNLASGQYKSKKSLENTIKGHSETLEKMKQKAPKDTETKKLDLSKANATELSKGNFKRLRKAIFKDKEMHIGGKIGTYLGLAAARGVNKLKKAGMDKVNTTFEELETKSKFYAKRQKQINEATPAAALAIPAIAGGTIGTVAAAPLAGALAVGVASKLAYDELQKRKNIKKSGELAGKLIGAHKSVDIEKQLPAKPDYPKATEVPDELKAKPAKSVVIPQPETKAAPVAKPATSAAAAPTNIPKDVKDTMGASLAASIAQTKATAGTKTDANAIAKAETNKNPPKDDKEGGGKGGAGFSLPSTEVEKVYRAPKEFALQVKTNQPKGDVRTTVQARDTALYRKAMQNEESESQENQNTQQNKSRVLKVYRAPKEFSMKVQTGGSKGNVRTSVSARDEIQYRRSLQQNESVLNQLYSINENEEKAINIANESVVINNTVAKKIISVYESVNKQNKEKIENMLNESVDSFKKIASFAARQ